MNRTSPTARRWWALALALGLGLAVPRAATSTPGPPILLASPPATPFTGRSLVVRDFDGIQGLDLAGIDGANIVIAARQANGTFAAEQSIPMGTTLESLQSADLDGDGRPDLVALSNGGHAILSRLNTGALTFGPPASVATDGAPRSLALGDLNGDGRPDGVTAITDSAFLEVSLNDGAGNLQTPARVPASGSPWFVAIGDFTGDGIADLLSVSRVFGLVVCVMPGAGDGTFGAPIVSTSTMSYRLSIGTADLDGDGDRDLVLFSDSGVSWLPNLGGGSFGAPVSVGLPNASYTSAYEPGQFAIGDVDGDGHPDIAVGLRRSRGWDDFHVLAVLVNRSDGTFFPPANYHVGGYPVDAALADFDGDGRLDGIVTTWSSSEVYPNTFGGNASVHFAYRLANLGSGVFDAHLEVESFAWMPVRRSDGPADLVGTNLGRLLRARNRGHGTFLANDDLGRGAPWRAADLDGDGNDDLIVTSSDSLWVRRALGGGSFDPPASIQTGLTPRDLADVDGDGRLDLVATDANLAVRVLPGNGAGGLGAPLDAGFTLPETPQDGAVRAVDANGDGRADLLFVPTLGQTFTPGPSQNGYRAFLHVVLNDGSGHFAPADSFELQVVSPSFFTKRLGGLTPGDFDGDHHPDVAMVSSGCGNDVIGWGGTWLGHGDGTFTAAGPGASADNSPCAVAASDLNGDGLDDLARTNSSGGLTLRVTMLTATGAGAFTQTASGVMGDYPDEVFLADMDGDGRADVVTRSARYRTASIRRNDTDLTGPTPSQLALVSARIEEGAAVLDWFAGDAPEQVTLERRTDATGWAWMADLAPDGTGHFRYADRELPAAARVAYRLSWGDASGRHETGETWLEIPASAFALRGAWPNPAPAAPTIAFELPRAGGVEIEVFDVSGRRLARERHEGLAAGPQRITMRSASLPPGVYLARVSFAGRRLDTRFVVMR
jgi:hypothetical protein